MDFTATGVGPIAAKTATGSLLRTFNLPIELSGVTVSINGLACGLKSVGGNRITFVAPPYISSQTTGTIYPITITKDGAILKTFVTIVPARPDIFNTTMTVAPGGRAKVFNVTNTVHTVEPFVIRTIKRKGGLLVPSVLRIYATGIQNVSSTVATIRIGSVVINGSNIVSNSILVDPGVLTLDFLLPAAAQGLGDQPIIFTITANGTTFESRLDDTTSRIFIL